MTMQTLAEQYANRMNRYEAETRTATISAVRYPHNGSHFPPPPPVHYLLKGSRAIAEGVYVFRDGSAVCDWRGRDIIFQYWIHYATADDALAGAQARAEQSARAVQYEAEMAQAS